MLLSRWLTPLVLALALVVIVGFVAYYAFSGATFRADDYATYEECIRNIPREWGPGSLERTRAEAACVHLHHPPAGRGN
jgi:hypothetical protein